MARGLSSATRRETGSLLIMTIRRSARAGKCPLDGHLRVGAAMLDAEIHGVIPLGDAYRALPRLTGSNSRPSTVDRNVIDRELSRTRLMQFNARFCSSEDASKTPRDISVTCAHVRTYDVYMYIFARARARVCV